MKNIKSRKPPTAVLVAVIAVVVAVSSAVAWLVASPAILDRIYSLSNFDAYAEVYFQDGATKVTPTKGTDGSIEVDVTNTSASNYIGKLRVDAYCKGEGSAFLRLKMIQQWQDSSDTILQADTVLPYSIATPYLSSDSGDQDKWYDNRRDDFCLYYANEIKFTNTVYTQIPIIAAGFSDSELAAVAPTGTGTVTLKIAFTLEAVQVNRYPQFWGIETLPWRA